MKLGHTLRELGHPVAYYAKLTPISGGATATLFLCQLIYWEGRQSDPEGWIYKTQEELEEETGLTRREQETARKQLRRRGLLRERFKGVPRRLEFSIDYDQLEDAWATWLAAEEKPVVEADPKPRTPYRKQDTATDHNGGNVHYDHNGGKRHYIKAENAIQECTKPPCNNGANVHACMAESAINLYRDYTETTNRDYTEKREREAAEPELPVETVGVSVQDRDLDSERSPVEDQVSAAPVAAEKFDYATYDWEQYEGAGSGGSDPGYWQFALGKVEALNERRRSQQKELINDVQAYTLGFIRKGGAAKYEVFLRATGVLPPLKQESSQAQQRSRSLVWSENWENWQMPPTADMSDDIAAVKVLWAELGLSWDKDPWLTWLQKAQEYASFDWAKGSGFFQLPDWAIRKLAIDLQLAAYGEVKHAA